MDALPVAKKKFFFVIPNSHLSFYKDILATESGVKEEFSRGAE